MYIVHSCSKCRRQFILIEDDLINMRKLNKDIYIVCPYCSSRNIKVSNKYEDLKECMRVVDIFKRENGKMKRI